MLKFNRWIIIFLAVVCLLPACAGLGISPADKELRLKERCTGFIAARAQGGNLSALRQYYREPDAAKLGQVMYRATEIISLEVTDDGLGAVTRLESEIVAMGFSFKGLKETLNWVWQEKDWFIVKAKIPAIPFSSKKK